MNNPLYNIIHFESSLRNGIILWGRGRVSDSIFKLQKRVLRVISGVSSRTSCTQIFKDYNVLTLPSLYIMEVICFIKKYKVFIAKNMDIHDYNTRRKLNLHTQHCNTVLFKRSVMNMGISLYNKVPNQVKLRKNFNSFRKELKSFLLKYSFYSVEEFMSYESLSV
jgi:hypothetical protein